MERVTGHTLTGWAAAGVIHLINSGAACLDGTGQETRDGWPCLKPFWEISPEEAGACLDATRWCPADVGYFRGVGFSSQFLTRGGMPVTMSRLLLVKGLGPVLGQVDLSGAREFEKRESSQAIAAFQNADLRFLPRPPVTELGQSATWASKETRESANDVKRRSSRS